MGAALVLSSMIPQDVKDPCVLGVSFHVLVLWIGDFHKAAAWAVIQAVISSSGVNRVAPVPVSIDGWGQASLGL